MGKNKKALIAFFLFLCSAHAFDPSLTWRTLTSPHFKVHFNANNEALARKVANIAENVHDELTESFDWVPEQPTHLVITDHTDLANGYATVFPRNRSVLFVHPPAAGRLDTNSWLEQLIKHEYTHVLHLDKADGLPKNSRRILGRNFFAFPNAFQPSWLIEGIATFHETNFSKNIGRGQSSRFAMMMREELRHGFRTVAEINMATTSWPLDARYLYGYYFYQFLNERYGEESIQSLVESYSNNIIPYALSTSTEEVTGKTLDELWLELEDYLNAELKSDGSISSHLQMTSNGFFKYDIGILRATVDATLDKSPRSEPNSFLYWIENDGFHQTALYKLPLSNQKLSNQSLPSQTLALEKVMATKKHLVDLNSNSSMDIHPTQGILISQPEICNEFYLYFDLFLYDESNNKLKRLTHCARYQEAQWSSSGNYIVAVKAEAGIFYLDKLTAEGSFLETLWVGQEDEVISDIDLSIDGETLLASVQRKGLPRANIEQFKVSSKQWIKLAPGLSQQWYPQYINDDQAVVFSSDKSGSYALYKYQFETQNLEQLTNNGRSFFRSRQLNKQFYALAYTVNGYELFQVDHTTLLADKPSNLTTPKNNQLMAHNPKKLERQSSVSKQYSLGRYQLWDSLAPTAWLPYTVGNENTFDIGAQTSGQDALEVHSYFAAFSIDIERQLPNLLLNYKYSNNWSFTFENKHDIEDDEDDSTADEVIRSRLFEMSYHIPVTELQSQWEVSFTTSLDNTRLGFWVNDELTYLGAFEDSLVGFSLSFNSSHQFLRSISESDGRSVRLGVASSNIIDSDFSGKTILLDWREYIQLHREHVLALRFVMGSGEQGTQRFKLGGDFGDPFILREPALIERDFALRGYEKNVLQFVGRQLRLFSAEWRFPMVHIERSAMVPPIGIEEISGKLFFDLGTVYDTQRLGSYSSSGVEILAQLRLGYFLPLNVRIGYANGNDSVLGQDEVYLHFGTSF